MNYEIFAQNLRQKFGINKETAQVWLTWAKELESMDHDYGDLENPKDSDIYLGEFWDRFLAIQNRFGDEVSKKVILVADIPCCLYPWEMFEAAVHFASGGSREDIPEIAAQGLLEENEQTDKKMSQEFLLPREKFENMLSAPSPFEKLLKSDVVLEVFSTDGTSQIKTCRGDICRTVDALMDYARLLEMVCDQWNLTGNHRASYELRHEQLRRIAGKLQQGIGYDYEKALRKCSKKQQKNGRDEGIGEDTLLLTSRGKIENGDSNGTH